MNYFKDRKSWAIAIAESGAILLFNFLFIKDMFGALGDSVQSKNVIIISSILFFARIVFFYLMLLWRTLWGRHEKET